MVEGAEASEGTFFTNAIAGCREDERMEQVTGAIIGQYGLELPA